MTMNYILNGPKCLIYLDTSESYILYLANEFIYNEDKIFVIFNHGFWTSTRNVKRNLRQKKKKKNSFFYRPIKKKKIKLLYQSRAYFGIWPKYTPRKWRFLIGQKQTLCKASCCYLVNAIHVITVCMYSRSFDLSTSIIPICCFKHRSSAF